MLKEEIEKTLKELENCKYVNFHFNDGDMYSCPPRDIIVYLDEGYIDALNQQITFQDLSYIDSYDQ